MAFAGYLKQSTAVDILIGPFVDDTDGKTAETGLTLDVEVSKNGQPLANKNDADAPTHDAAGTVDGYYNCELDTTDTGTLGILTVVAHAAGFLPVRLDYQIVTANWYDTMCSTDQLDTNVTNIEGSDATDQITASAPTAAVIADAVWDEAASGHVAAGSFGQQCGTDIDAILADTNELQTDDYPTSIAALPTAVENRTEMDSNSTQLAAIVADTNELQTDDYPTSIAAIKSDTEAILTDTAELQTDDVPTLIAALPTAAENRTEMDSNSTQLAAIVADTNELQTDDYPTSIAAVKSDTEAILTDTAELQTDDVPTLIAALPTAAENRTEMDSNSTQLAAIVADTNELQTDDYPTSIAAVKSDTAAILTDTNELQTDDVPTLIAALNDISTADVNAEVDDVISTDTQTLPGQAAPSATPTLAAAIMYLYKAFRNKIDQDATTLQIYADNGSTVDQKATISDDGSTYTRGEIGTGP